MRINIIQHVVYESPGAIIDWAKLHGHQVYVYYPVDCKVQFPKAAETDLLVILGGGDVNSSKDWILKEQALISNMMDVSKPVLGICFGMQQIAKVLGGNVVPTEKEAGLGMVEKTSSKILDLPIALTVFKWHSQCCKFPAYISSKIEKLFKSNDIEYEGILVNQNVVGLQFHLETTQVGVREIVLNNQEYLKDSKFKQYATEIMEYPVPRANQEALFRILDYIVKR